MKPADARHVDTPPDSESWPPGGGLFAGFVKLHIPSLSWEDIRPLADELFLSPYFSNEWRVDIATPLELLEIQGAILAMAVQAWADKSQAVLYSQPLSRPVLRQAAAAARVIQDSARLVALDLQNMGYGHA